MIGPPFFPFQGGSSVSNRFRHFFVIRSVRRKMMVAAIACILLPAAFNLVLYNNLTQSAVKKQAIANSQESLLLVNGYVTNLLKSMLSIANYVQQNSDMNTYFKMLATGQPYEGSENAYQRFKQTNAITGQLDTLATIGEHFYVTVLLTNGDYFMNYSIDDYNPLKFAEQPWFGDVQKLKGLQSYWVAATPTVFKGEKKKNPYQISVARPLRTMSTKVYGYVIVTMMENQMNTIFSRLAGDGKVMLVDSSKRILSDRDAGQIGKSFPYLEWVGVQMSSEIVPIGDSNFLMTQLPLQFAGWRLVSMQPYKEAIVNINSIFNRVFIFQMISFLVFLLLLLMLMRRFTQPLIRLGKTAATVQRGNLSVRSEVRGQDEIGRLGYSFDQMLDKVNEMIEEVSLTHNRKRMAELAMLQAQINPHFLFNVLNSIRMKVMLHGDRESAEMIESLSRLLRMTISQVQDSIPLHEEIELVLHYLKLMNMRQREKVKLEVEVSQEALMIEVPRFCLQPVIENALIHGLNRCAGIVRISAGMEAGGLKLSIEDNGAGMGSAEAEALSRKMMSSDGTASGAQNKTGNFSGIGLCNVYERMKMTFGDRFRMEVRSVPGKWTQILMVIPGKEESVDVQRNVGG